MNAVMLDRLSKSYDAKKRAVDDVTISLAPGEVFGFLGPNGAGKTTTVKLLTGMLTPTAGSCSVFGVDPARDPQQVHACSGVVTEHAQMYDTLTGLQNLVFYGSVYGLDSVESKKRADALLEQLELTEARDKKLAAYSTGMRQRLSLARALLHEPQILFLDEPTSGLDPESARRVHEIIRNLAKEKGITVFLCTHQLRYAQEICTSYGLMDQGRLFARGSLADFRREAGFSLQLTMKLGGISPQDLAEKISCDKVMPEGNRMEVSLALTGEDEIPGLVRRAMEAGADIYQVVTETPSLEDVYFALIEKQKATVE